MTLIQMFQQKFLLLSLKIIHLKSLNYAVLRKARNILKAEVLCIIKSFSLLILRLDLDDLTDSKNKIGFLNAEKSRKLYFMSKWAAVTQKAC